MLSFQFLYGVNLPYQLSWDKPISVLLYRYIIHPTLLDPSMLWGVSLELSQVNKVALLGVTKSLSFFPGGINEWGRFSGSVLQVQAVVS